MTEPEALGRWLAPPPGVSVARTEPPRVLELDWSPPGEPQSTVRIELHAEGERTVLVLEHTLIDATLGMRYMRDWSNALDAIRHHTDEREADMTQSIYPYLLYHSCEDALDWLTRAFGFEEDLRYTGEAGYVNHAEMHLGDAHIFMGNPGEGYRNPKEQGGETIGLYVYVDDVDAHYARAKEAGAEITEEPHGPGVRRAPLHRT